MDVLAQCYQRTLHDFVQVLVGRDAQYSQQLTNSVVTNGLAHFQPPWKCLAASKASYW